MDKYKLYSSALHRATRAEINLSALQSNLNCIRDLISSKVKIMAVVKADAYGHGVIPCSQVLVDAGADILGVSIISEGIELRNNGFQVPIHILMGVFPDEVDDLIQFDLTTSIWSLNMAKKISERASHFGKKVGVHIKVDSGMGRLGVWPENLLSLTQEIHKLPNLKIESIFTHFSSADEECSEYSLNQLNKFNSALELLNNSGISLPTTHCANSAALIKYSQSHLSQVRPGLLIYGVKPISKCPHSFDAIQPVMELKTQIIQIKSMDKGASLSYSRTHTTQKPSRIATIPLGYADGLFRSLSNNMEVIISGKKVPQVGNICMDMSLIDITDIPSAKEGDPVVIFGRQGEESIYVEELAQKAGTIPYEILCAVGKRIPRIYIP